MSPELAISPVLPIPLVVDCPATLNVSCSSVAPVFVKVPVLAISPPLVMSPELAISPVLPIPLVVDWPVTPNVLFI